MLVQESSASVATAGVVGREEERGAIEAFLTVVEQGPAALVLAGEAGSERRCCGRPASTPPSGVALTTYPDADQDADLRDRRRERHLHLDAGHHPPVTGQLGVTALNC
jgi:hypothetical protein